MKKVMAFGSFDIIHPGHIFFTKSSKALGDCLVVVVARDSTIRKLKGKSPHYPEKTRLMHVRRLGIADKVILGSKRDYFERVVKLKPDIIALGYDQRFLAVGLKEKLKALGISTRIKRIAPYRAHIYKSSLLRKRIARA